MNNGMSCSRGAFFSFGGGSGEKGHRPGRRWKSGILRTSRGFRGIAFEGIIASAAILGLFLASAPLCDSGGLCIILFSLPHYLLLFLSFFIPQLLHLDPLPPLPHLHPSSSLSCFTRRQSRLLRRRTALSRNLVFQRGYSLHTSTSL